MIVPGLGTVFVDVGRIILDFETGLVFIKGQHQYFGGDVAGLCAVLA